LNFLMFDMRENAAAALELRPNVMQFASARAEQDLTRRPDRAHRSRAESLAKLRVAREWDDVDEGLFQRARMPDSFTISRQSPKLSLVSRKRLRKFSRIGRGALSRMCADDHPN
jgi:hypothetical protein